MSPFCLPTTSVSTLKTSSAKAKHPREYRRVPVSFFLLTVARDNNAPKSKLPRRLWSVPQQSAKFVICQICRRFVIEGMGQALREKPRPGQPPKITGEVESRLCLLACSDPPKGQSHWTLRLLVDKLIELGYVESISTVAVHQRLKKMKSNPGR